MRKEQLGKAYVHDAILSEMTGTSLALLLVLFSSILQLVKTRLRSRDVKHELRTQVKRPSLHEQDLKRITHRSNTLQ